MPCDLAYAANVLVITYSGAVTIESLVDCAAQIARQIRRYNAVLADYSRVESFSLTPSEIRLLAECYEFSHHPRAIVAPPGTHVFGLGRMFETLVEHYSRVAPVRIFDRSPDALLWLAGQSQG